MIGTMEVFRLIRRQRKRSVSTEGVRLLDPAGGTNSNENHRPNQKHRSYASMRQQGPDLKSKERNEESWGTLGSVIE